MMREILFRGKRIDNGKWIVGHLLRYENGRARIIESHTDIFCYENDENTIVALAYEVAPETVGQFTGLTDNNGKMVFEGDIIKAHYANCQKPDHVEQVVFCDGRFCSEVALVGNGVMRAALPYSAKHIKSDKSIYMEWCEVIGNIHDDPELLEGGEDG